MSYRDMLMGLGPEPIALGAKVTKAEAEEIEAELRHERTMAALSAWTITPEQFATKWDRAGRALAEAKVKAANPLFAVPASVPHDELKAAFEAVKSLSAEPDVNGKVWFEKDEHGYFWPSELLYGGEVGGGMAAEHHRSQPPQPSGMATEPSTRDGVYEGVNAIPDRTAIADLAYCIIDDSRRICLRDGRRFWAREEDYRRLGMKADWHLMPEDDGA